MIEPIEYSLGLKMRAEIPPSGERIVESARHIARSRGRQYARASSPVSPEPRLTGNVAPQETPLRWLRGLDKCNQFVGDVLYGAGFRMPLFLMPDGSSHYRHAAALPGEREFFTPVTRREAIAPGDILVIRHPGRGENSGHVEIITGVEPRTGALTTLGAHARGVEERQRSLPRIAVVPAAWEKGDDRWFVLRSHATFSIED